MYIKLLKATSRIMKVVYNSDSSLRILPHKNGKEVFGNVEGHFGLSQ